MIDMRTITFTGRSRARLLHVETELAIINIYRGHDLKGRYVERIEIREDQYPGEHKVRVSPPVFVIRLIRLKKKNK